MYKKEEVFAIAGYWDCVRIGADNEYFRRLKKLCGEQRFTEIDDVLLIQLSRKGSLTNDPITRVNVRNNSSVRHLYRLAYRKYHKKLNRINGR